MHVSRQQHPCTGVLANQPDCHCLQEDGHLPSLSGALPTDPTQPSVLFHPYHTRSRKQGRAGLGIPQRTRTSSGGSGCERQAEPRLIVLEHRQPGKPGAKRRLSYGLLWLLSELKHRYPYTCYHWGLLKNILKGMKIEKRGMCQKGFQGGKMSVCEEGLGILVNSGGMTGEASPSRWLRSSTGRNLFIENARI